MTDKNDETPKPEVEEAPQSPFRIREELPLADRLSHAHKRLEFANKLRLGYHLSKVCGVEDQTNYFDGTYVQMVEELTTEALEALHEAEAEIEQEEDGSNGGPSPRTWVH